MKGSSWLVAMLVAFAAMLVVDAAHSWQYIDFNLKLKMSRCAGPGTYTADVTWTPTPKSSAFFLSTGNACQLNGQACTKSSKCKVTCAGPAPCEVHLSVCLQGRGSAWLGIHDGAGQLQSKNINTLPPDRCR
jgi:hypothetical protein